MTTKDKILNALNKAGTSLEKKDIAWRCDNFPSEIKEFSDALEELITEGKIEKSRPPGVPRVINTRAGEAWYAIVLSEERSKGNQ